MLRTLADRFEQGAFNGKPQVAQGSAFDGLLARGQNELQGRTVVDIDARIECVAAEDFADCRQLAGHG